jgi:hypothetical protein
MNYRFNIKFVIFNEEENLSKIQEEIKESMIMGELLIDILKNEFNDDMNYKLLERAECAISSINDQKQLRLWWDTCHIKMKKYKHSLHFNQHHSFSGEYFTIEELKYISQKIKKGLEEFLHYEIDEPIIYIEICDL